MDIIHHKQLSNILKNKIKEARFYHWYSYSGDFITKSEKFDLEWAKSIKDNYEKYL